MHRRKHLSPIRIGSIDTIVDDGRAPADLAERSGYSIEAFGRLAGVDAKAPADPDARIPVEVMKRCLKIALEMTGNPALGLAVGADYSSNSHGVLGHLIAHSETWGDALRVLCRYFVLLTDWQRMELKEAGAQTWITWGRRTPTRRFGPPLSRGPSRALLRPKCRKSLRFPQRRDLG